MIDAIMRGDEFAFEKAYVQHREKIYGYLLKKTRSAEDASDLMQTVFFRLWKYRKSLSTEYLLEQQLFNIARTVFIDYLRASSKKLLTAQRMAREAATNPVYAYTSTAFDLRSRISAALSGMPEIRRKVFELSRIEGFSYQEISQHLSITVKSVDNNLAKALKQLRKLLVCVAIILFSIS